MKVGIATFQWSDNYGAVLQVYALQSYLEKKGHLVQIIDFRPKPSVSVMKKILAKTPQGCIRKWEAYYKEVLFENFRNKCLKRTSKTFSFVQELKSLADKYDLMITGSDQVWNPRWISQYEGLKELYFLSFAGKNTKRISYAASFGHAETSTMEKRWQKIIGENLEKFDAISVREASGVGIVRGLSGRTDAAHVVDPTLLLSRDDYNRLVGQANYSEAYAFSYILHGLDRDVENVLQGLSDTLDLTILKCNIKKTGIHKCYTLPSPVCWLNRIKNADFMVTNSFHGVVFCLIFHTPFIALLIEGEMGAMNARIVDLLKAVGLEHWVFFTRDSVSQGLFQKERNWRKVDQKISLLRSNSIRFLEHQGV